MQCDFFLSWGLLSRRECLKHFYSYQLSQPVVPSTAWLWAHTECKEAALTCLYLKTSLERVHHEALIHTMTVADWNWPMAFSYNVSIVLCIVNTTDDCTIQRQEYETLHLSCCFSIHNTQTLLEMSHGLNRQHLVLSRQFTNIPLITLRISLAVYLLCKSAGTVSIWETHTGQHNNPKSIHNMFLFSLERSPCSNTSNWQLI